ncbi:MAG: NADH-quinone oxidoreductase subunit C [Candidatus Manganitrophus sp.]|nr:NADH-quinone oxidoreductase subunit C [Candidatus Manganitrophus sp.]
MIGSRLSGLSTKEKIHDLLRYVKNEIDRPYKMLYDLTGIDERVRVHREGQPDSDFTAVYHLLLLRPQRLSPLQSPSR